MAPLGYDLLLPWSPKIIRNGQSLSTPALSKKLAKELAEEQRKHLAEGTEVTIVPLGKVPFVITGSFRERRSG